MVKQILTAGPDVVTREQRLILWLLSAREQADAPGNAELEMADWAQLLGLAGAALHPYLQFTIEESGWLDRLGRRPRQMLERAGTEAMLRYLRRKSELQTVLAQLADAGIEAVLLKGASLSELVYPAAHLRPMLDVDLWIAEAEMEHAQRLLEGLGYRVKPYPDLESDPHSGREIRLGKPFANTLSVVELHASLDIHLPREWHEAEAIWQRSLPHPTLRARMLCPRDMVYHLCLHLAMRHRFERGLLWLLDLRLYLERFGAQVDWCALSEDGRRQRSVKYLSVSFWLVQNLLGLRLPETALVHLQPPMAMDTVQSLAWRQLWYSELLARPPRRLVKMVTAGSPAAMAASLASRFHRYSTGNTKEEHRPEGWRQRLWSGLRWFSDDLVKAYRGLRRGGYLPSNFRKACAIEMRRAELHKALQD